MYLRGSGITAYFEEKLASRDQQEHVSVGFPVLDGTTVITDGYRFGEDGVRSMGRKLKLSEWPWPEGYSGGRPLPVPWWMTGDVSSWENVSGTYRPGGLSEAFAQELASGTGEEGKLGR